MTTELFKLLRKASIQKQKINKRLDQYSQPFSQLRDFAASQNNNVKMGVQKNKHFNDNFRRLEEEDRKRKEDILTNIQERTATIFQNKQRLVESKKKQAKAKNDKVQKTFKRHIEDELNKEREEEEEAMKVRRERVEEIEQKQKGKVNFIRRKGSYDQAMQKIKKRDQLIQDFALSTSQKIDNSFSRNCKKMNPEHEEARMQKQKKYLSVLQEQKMLLGLRTNRCIQLYCSNLQSADKMNQYKRSNWNILSKTIKKFNQTHSQKAKLNKQYNDDELKQIAQKCSNRMNRFSNGKQAGQTASTSFMLTSKTWRSEGRNKRDYMKTIQEGKKDQIINKHQSATVRNKEQSRTQTKFSDLIRKASFIARQIL